jgi:hypothetical protein
MRNLRVMLLLAFALLLASCGGGNSSTGTNSSGSSGATTPTAPNITGNWSITVQSTVAAGSVQVGGSLVSNGTQVSGVLHVLNSSCFQIADDVPVSGSITAGSNAITLTSGTVESQVVTVNGTVAADGKSISSGTYTIAGGCDNTDHGSLTGFVVPPFINTYTGTFISATAGSATNVSATITQAATADGDGLFHVTGTVMFPNGVCFTSATVTPSSAAIGGFLVLDLATNTGADVLYVGQITDSSGKTINGQYHVNSGNCAGDSGTGNVSHS